MAVSKAQQKAVNKYMAANYDRINLTVAKGQRDMIKAHAATCGESVNGFIGRAIFEAMERDRNGATPQQPAGGPRESGMVSLPSSALKTAQEAAQAAGEGLPQFIARAVETQAQRDKVSRKLGGAQ